MSKINKHANLYDKEGNIIRRVNDKGILPDYSIEELEQLLDELGKDKDNEGRIRNAQAFNNASSVLMMLYKKFGNPHEKEIIDRIKEAQKTKTTEKQVEQALQQVNESIAEEKYDEYEEIAA